MLGSITSFLLHNTMITLMLAIGLRTPTHVLDATWLQRDLVWKGLLVLLLGVPVLALITVTVLPLDRETTAFIALMAVCPGAPLIFRKFRDRPIVVTIIAVVSLLVPLTVGIWLSVISRTLGVDLSVDSGTLAKVMVKQVLPLGIGVLIASIWPIFADRLGRVVWWVFTAGFVLALGLVVYKGAPALLDIDVWTGIAVIVMVIGSIAMGHWAGHPDLEDSRMLATIAVLGNPAVAIAVLSSTFPGYRPRALFAGYLVLRALALLPYARWSKKHADRSNTDTTVGPPGALPANVVPAR